MRIVTSFRILTVASFIALLTACSGGGTSSVSPIPSSPQAGDAFHARRFPSFLKLNPDARANFRFLSFNNCPFTGATVYVSDTFNNVIYAYHGKFAGQAPCGQIASPLLVSPLGLYVNPTTHDLYVANWGAFNILVFHKARSTPYNTYTDPTGQEPNDVVVNSGGVVMASNEEAINGIERGSISTWVGGPNGGTFVGNFPMTNDDFGLFITLKSFGTVYFNDVDSITGIGALWKVKCPSGVCGTLTRVTGVSLLSPGGMAFDDMGRLLVNDTRASTVNTFHLPDPNPSTVSVPCCPYAMALDELHNRFFYTSLNYAAEYSYPNFKLKGKVTGHNGALFGIAVDP